MDGSVGAWEVSLTVSVGTGVVRGSVGAGGVVFSANTARGDMTHEGRIQKKTSVNKNRFFIVFPL
jgi:hypothetical protein